MLVPAVSLRGGEVVVVKDHAYEPVEDDSGSPFALDEFVEVFLKDYPAVLVFDIDGLEGERPQYDEVAKLGSARPEIWWDGGARREDDVISIITSGADRAVVSAGSIADYRELEACVEVTENLVFEVVGRGREVQASSRDFAGRTAAQVAALAARAGVEDLLLIDSARPLGGPVDWELVASASPGWKRVFVGGGLDASTAGSLRAPAQVPLGGAVVDLISILARFM
jgi:phosphoribosylformimino-5-aminoimidazole carboxamide ribonucleotide (ProFAR) isomerase